MLSLGEYANSLDGEARVVHTVSALPLTTEKSKPIQGSDVRFM